MAYIYDFLDLILPFSWVDYKFMKNALLAMLVIAPLMGILGTMAVNNKMAFFSDALGHSALTGVALGVLLGIKNEIARYYGRSVYRYAVSVLFIKNFRARFLFRHAHLCVRAVGYV